MNHKQYLTSYGSSLMLKDLGMPQDSMFKWSNLYGFKKLVFAKKPLGMICAAYTTNEITDRFPAYFMLNGKSVSIVYGKSDIGHHFEIQDNESRLTYMDFVEKRQIEAAALMLIYLVKHGVIEFGGRRKRNLKKNMCRFQ